MDFWTCDLGHKHATEKHALDCNKATKEGKPSLFNESAEAAESKAVEKPTPKATTGTTSTTSTTSASHGAAGSHSGKAHKS